MPRSCKQSAIAIHAAPAPLRTTETFFLSFFAIKRAFKSAALSTRDEAKEVWVDIGDYVGLDIDRSYVIFMIRICTETYDFTPHITLRTDLRDDERFGYAEKRLELVHNPSYEAFFKAVEGSEQFHQAMLRTFVDTDVVCDQIPPP